MKHLLHIGDRVRSRYRAPWKGNIVDERLIGGNGRDAHRIVQVAIDTDRHDNPMRRVLKMWIDPHWLEYLGPAHA